MLNPSLILDISNLLFPSKFSQKISSLSLPLSHSFLMKNLYSKFVYLLLNLIKSLSHKGYELGVVFNFGHLHLSQFPSSFTAPVIYISSPSFVSPFKMNCKDKPLSDISFFE